MNNAKKILVIIFVIVLSISMCPVTSVSAAKNTKVKLSKTKATIYVGKTVSLKLKNNKKAVKWTTSNKKIATVSKKGKVKGKKAGKVTITAKVGKKKYKCKVTVKKKPVKKQVEQPTTKPSEKPTTKPVDYNIVIPAGCDKSEAEALIELINEQKNQGADVSTVLTDEDQYKWENGKLIGLYWGKCGIKGSLDYSPFTSLKEIGCEQNKGVTSIDVSKNTALEELYCWDTSISSLDVTTLSSLVYLDCPQTNLSTLDVSKNSKLEVLYCGATKIATLDLKNNVNLKEVSVYGTNIENLDVSNNVNLELINCTSTKIKNIDLSKNIELQYFTSIESSLESLDLTNNVHLKSLSLSNCPIKEIDVSNKPELELFEIALTEYITSAKVTNNPNLKQVSFWGDTKLVNLEISNCPAIEKLVCYLTGITQLDVSNFPKLVELNCSYTKITTLDVSNNPLLTNLSCNDDVKIIGYNK